ncbi:MAG TPA: CapA family protein [Marmoricola sp.]|nr:CapA family protein [Marmoricola sp.]
MGRTATCLAVAALALAGCTVAEDVGSQPGPTTGAAPSEPAAEPRSEPPDEGPRGVVTLGFAGDVHFEYHLRGLLTQPRAAFGSLRRVMKEPDLMMVNLESAITERGTEEPKLYRFRVSAAALDLLKGAGVDVASLANNHAADYGAVGLRDTLAAVRRSPVPVLGVGRDADAAFRPLRTSIRGTRIAVHVASTKRDRTANHWAAGDGVPGVAVALHPRGRLLREVRRSAARAHVVVVYLHWGYEGKPCPTDNQVEFAEALSAAGADIVVGSHAHVLLGSGWLGETYVSYGLGNFLWYNQHVPRTGILKIRVKDGEVVGDTWVPARHTADGPELLAPRERAGAVDDWRALRGCSGLAAAPR